MLTRLATEISKPVSVPRPQFPIGNVNGGAFLDSIGLMGVRISYPRNAEIYGEGEPVEYLYRVITGAVRICKILDDGRRQVTVFHLPGEIFGLELGKEHRLCAEAIGDCNILVVKRSAVLALAERDGEVARQLWTLTADALSRLQEHMLVLGCMSARERVATFLLHLAGGISGGNEIDLPMSRQDIADYLGLTIETVSRTMTQLENDAAIGLQTSRHIVLLNRAALGRLNS
jgi:CRP/FNR family transcriptional regulator, nitrogen fixation regulation protein